MSDMLPPEPPQAPPPPPPRSPYGDPSGAGPGFNRQEAEAAVNIPGIGLMVTGGLSIIANLFGLISPSDPESSMELLESFGFFENPDVDPEQLRQIMESMSAGGTAMSIVFSLLAIAVSGLVLYGGLQMRRLQSYGLSMTACILSFIPCFTSCCCILGLVFGIWGIVALNKPEVKEAFS